MVRLRNERRGFALVAALWLLVLIAGVAAALQGVAVSERRAAANVQETIQARWAARGAIAYALQRLDGELQRSAVTGLSGAGRAIDSLLRPAQYIVDGSVARVVIDDPRGRVNVNRADLQQLIALFRAAGLDAASASNVAAEIGRGRHERAGSSLRLSAEDDANGPFPPLGRAFAELDELATLPSVDASTYARIAPYLTVAGDGRVNVNLAPAAVLYSLPGLDSAAIATIIARRAAAPFHNPFEVSAALASASRMRLQARFAAFVDAVAFAPRDVVVEATVRGRSTRVTALVRLHGGAAWSVVGSSMR